MEALRVQRRENGRVTGLLTRADSPVGGASCNTSDGAASNIAGAGTARNGAATTVRYGMQFAPAFAVAGSGLPDAATLAEAIAVVKAAAAAAPDILAMADYADAANFAAQAEDLSRTVEYLQILSAGAVDRTRTQAITAAATAPTRTGRTWITGWDNSTETPTETLAETDAAWPHGSADPTTVGEAGFTTPDAQSDAPASSVRSAAPDGSAARVGPVPASPAEDGCKNTAEFLRARLRISLAEAHRRITLAAAVLPRPGITGNTQPPERPELATALAAGTVASRPATIITLALERVSHHTNGDTTARMEHALTRTAAENDTDFLTRIARRWTEAIDQDGTEPTDHELHQRQGAFLRPARRGLNHIEIFATPDQYEHLLTVMNTATNPRIHPTTETGDAGKPEEAGAGKAGAREAGAGETGETTAPDANLDRRTRPQQLLDGLVGACKAALTTGALPATGGLRPQIMVTINYLDLLDRLEHATAQGPRYRSRTTGTTTDPATTDPGSIPATTDPGSIPGTTIPDPATTDPGTTTDHTTTRIPDPGRIPGTGSFAFTGPVTAATVRKIACDADIIPILLGSEGRILDIGRTTRVFPPHIRKAITARDQGCAFPGCTIPAPWCEAHHITYWSHGGTTSTDNGTLLCTHHHHLIHKEQWQIQVKTGIPWFIPPPHIDPRQKPQRNHHQT